MLRKQYSPVLSRYISITLKVSYCDSSLVKTKPKLKSLVEDDFSMAVKKPFVKNFVENLFVKEFQPKILEYPQLDTIEEIDRLKLYCQFAQKLITEETPNEEGALVKVDSKNAVAALKNYEFTGFKIPRVKNGFGFLSSQYSYMQEALAIDPSLCKSVCENEDFGIQLIDSFGNDMQKAEYLSKLISGEYISSFAHLESGYLVPFGETSLSTSAVLSSDNESYVLSGTKTWVYNANSADIFILSACIKKDGEPSKPTLFLVNKNLPGVVVHEPIETLGMKNLSVCKVTLNDVVVPSTCILGNISEGDKIIKEVLCKGKLNIGGQCLGIMKKLINTSIKHCIYNEFFDKEKYNMDQFRIKIGHMASKIYVAESMTYLLTGRFDSHTDADVFLESLIVKIYCSEALQFVLKEALGILGNEFFSSDENLSKFAKDSQFFIACDDTNNHLRLVLASAGLKYAMNCQKSPNKKLSNFFDSINLQKSLLRDSVVIFKEELQGYLHLMFHRESALLEDSIDILDDCTRYLIRKYGENVFHKYSHLKYLANIAINIYAMSATLGRASRAYCLALQHHEADRLTTESAIRMLAKYNRHTRKLMRQLDMFDDLSKISSSITGSNKYSDVYSVTRNLKARHRNNRVRLEQ